MRLPPCCLAWSVPAWAARRATAASTSHGCTIHDYARAIDFLIQHPEINGPVNMTSPNPQPNSDFMRAIRNAWKMPIGLPAYAWSWRSALSFCVPRLS